MRTYFIVVLFFCSLLGFGQSVTIKITREKLQAAKNIRDLIPGIPADCKVRSFEISISINGSLKAFMEGPLADGELPEGLRSEFTKLEKGKSLFIEKVGSSCATFFKSKGYKITAE